jgi:hypothetical protein
VLALPVVVDVACGPSSRRSGPGSIGPPVDSASVDSLEASALVGSTVEVAGSGPDDDDIVVVESVVDGDVVLGSSVDVASVVVACVVPASGESAAQAEAQ